MTFQKTNEKIQKNNENEKLPTLFPRKQGKTEQARKQATYINFVIPDRKD